ncbi:MAG: holo-ACP synthase [Myxococcales bacterium]|jgi:holo-[acyl-carrier protein] synthase|nr:holo-ACP synthase [Myxococcales bacterium]
MILGVGVDICPVQRIEDIVARQGDAFVDKVFTETERRYATGRAQGERLAARWAAKEAAIKALGAPTGMKWHDIWVQNRPDGAPELQLAGAAAARFAQLGAVRTWLTLSHAGGMAVAVVIIEGAP